MRIIFNLIAGAIIGLISHKTEGPIERAFVSPGGDTAHLAKYGVGFVVTFTMFGLLVAQRKYPECLSKQEIHDIQAGQFVDYILAWFATGAGVLLGHLIDVWRD